MGAYFDRLAPQPLIGIATLAIALGGVVMAWLISTWQMSGMQSTPGVLLPISLVGALVLTYQFPIHLRHNAKIYMGSVVLYLMAVLLPPALGATAAGIGLLSGELSVRSRKGTYLGDIATDTGRLLMMVLLASLVAHVQVPFARLGVMPLIGAGLVLWIGDILTCPLAFAPVSGERPERIILAVIQEAGVVEGGQYVVGIIGALLARQGMWTLLLILLPIVVTYIACKRLKELREGTREILESMADAVDLRDSCTGGHSRRVTDLTAHILSELGKTGPEVDLIVWAARVHDIGKIGIPDDVLKKPGRLSPEEQALMETHPGQGASLLKRYPDFARGAAVVRHHHERWDGMGYPHRLKGLEIPFGARVVAVADSFDAMTSDRPYRRGMSTEQAAAILAEGRGRQWDPALVDAFLRSMADRLERPAVPNVTVIHSALHRHEPAVTVTA